MESYSDQSRAATESATQTKTILLVRHGTSIANEWMAKDGNNWGQASFRDDVTLRDSGLSQAGRRQTLEKQSSFRNVLESFVADDEDDQQPPGFQPDLVVVSPLRRTLETLDRLVIPVLQKQQLADDVPILAQPFCTERVYTTSDTGTMNTRKMISREFPYIDTSLLPTSTKEGDEDPAWWYTRDATGEENQYDEEWRPHEDGQWYGVPGEPQGVFEARMEELEDWIWSRPERRIIMVTHWAICRYFTGEEFSNCEAGLVRLFRKDTVCS